jgi:diaminopimelate epimerase
MHVVTKHHGLGNDFLVVHDTGLGGDLHGDDHGDEHLAEMARRWCDRRRGVGADGLLVATPASGFAARMTLFNADGSRAEISGNGIRCFAQALAMRSGSYDDQLILTDAGERLVSLAPTEDPDTVLATVDMGSVDRLDEPTGWGDLGCHPDRPVSHLSLGNPHSVVGVDDVTEVDLVVLGAKVPHVNLEIVQAGERQHEVHMRVHERGAGLTEACGTGACASAFAAASWGLATPRDGKLVVHMDGGSATVELDTPSAGRVTLTGPATYVATIKIGTS